MRDEVKLEGRRQKAEGREQEKCFVLPSALCLLPSLLSSLRPPPSFLDEWTLSAPGIHGECVPMRDLSQEEVDFCIVGAGAGGGVVGAKLAEAGFSVVILDAGPHWNPVKDFVSDEMAS